MEKIEEQMFIYQHQRGPFKTELMKNGAKNPNLKYNFLVSANALIYTLVKVTKCFNFQFGS